MYLTSLRDCYAPVNVVKAVWLPKIGTFFETIRSSVINGFRNLAFGDHCSANFQPILDCFIPKFKLEYDDLENIKTDRVNTGGLFEREKLFRSK